MLFHAMLCHLMLGYIKKIYCVVLYYKQYIITITALCCKISSCISTTWLAHDEERQHRLCSTSHVQGWLGVVLATAFKGGALLHRDMEHVSTSVSCLRLSRRFEHCPEPRIEI